MQRVGSETDLADRFEVVVDPDAEPADWGEAILTLLDRLRQSGDIEAVGGAAANLAEMMHTIASPSNAPHHARIIKAHAERVLLFDPATVERVLVERAKGTEAAR